MGQLRFVMPDRDRLSLEAAERAYLTGMEGVPFVSRNYWDGEEFVLQREVRESGNLHLLWNVPGHRALLLSTASMMERSRPYLLPVELARGMLHRLRHQQALWQSIGLVDPPEFAGLERQALRHLAQAITRQTDPRAAQAEADASLSATLLASDALALAFRRQMLALRHQQSPQLPTLLAAALPHEPLAGALRQQFLSGFNAASVPLSWRDIEPSEGQFDWSISDSYFRSLERSGLKVCAGPLLRLDAASLPDWLYLWEDDFESLQGCIYQYLTAVVQRYQGQVHVWHCAGGLNQPGGLSLSEEQKLRLGVLSIDTVRRSDAKTPIVMSFDQPWAEYLRHVELDLPPYHFADALVRADLGLAGVGLEINLGYWPGGTQPRDTLELGRLIDRWSMLGVPLLAILTGPSAASDDPLARQKTQVLFPATPEVQAELMGGMVEMLLAKQAVHAIVWNQYADSEPHAWPHGGLIARPGEAKPLLARLVQLRKDHCV